MKLSLLAAIEGLSQRLEADTAETPERVDLLNELAEKLFFVDDLPRLFETVDKALTLSERLSYDRGRARGLTLLAMGHVMRSELDEALEALDQAHAVFEGIDDPLGVAKYQWPLANVQRNLGNFDDAIPNTYAPLSVMEAHGDPYWLGMLYYSLGLLHYEFGDYERSLNYYLLSCEMDKDIDEKWLIGRSLVGVGSAYERLGDYEQALRYCKDSLRLFEQSGNVFGEARALTDIGSVHLSLGNVETSIECHQRALRLRQESGHRPSQSTSLLHLGRAFLHQRDATKALETLHRAMTIAEEWAIKPRMYQIHLELSKAYELKGDALRAFLHYKSFNRVRDEIFGNTPSAEIKTRETQREVESVEREAEIARLGNVELRQKNEQLERLLEELRSTQARLVQSEKMAALGRLTAGITHEINTPIAVLKSQSDIINRCVAKLDENTGDAATLVAMLGDSSRLTLEASDRIGDLLENLKTFTQLDRAEMGPLDVHAGLDSAIALLGPEMKDGIEVVRRYGELPPLRGHAAEMNQVFMTLLRSAGQSIKAIKAIECKGAITIETVAEGEFVTIAISDDGKGLPPEELDGLFDVGFTSSSTRVRFEMGLATAYRVVDKHGGRIEATSAPGNGTMFNIVLPIANS